VVLLSVGPSSGGDQLTLQRGAQAWDIDWSDAEDRVNGHIRPIDPVQGRELTISLHVGAFQGPDFDGPVMFTLRGEGDTQSQTVQRAKGEKAWFARFVPAGSGEYSIDISYAITRHKLLHAKVSVTPAPLSRVPWYVLVAVLALGALGFGLRAVLKKPESAA
jgi:hypothetical protein